MTLKMIVVSGFALFVLSALVSGQASAACSEGVFTVGTALLPESRALGDTVTIAGGEVTLGNGCAASVGRVRVTPFGTLIRARWRDCPSVGGQLLLRARILPDCSRMVGVLISARPRGARRFVATACPGGDCFPLCTSNADCGTDGYCSKTGEGCGARSGICHRKSGLRCPGDVDPVCGCDGKTYSNDCRRRAAGAQLLHDGACE